MSSSRELPLFDDNWLNLALSREVSELDGSGGILA